MACSTGGSAKRSIWRANTASPTSRHSPGCATGRGRAWSWRTIPTCSAGSARSSSGPRWTAHPRYSPTVSTSSSPSPTASARSCSARRSTSAVSSLRVFRAILTSNQSRPLHFPPPTLPHVGGRGNCKRSKSFIPAQKRRPIHSTCIGREGGSSGRLKSLSPALDQRVDEVLDAAALDSHVAQQVIVHPIQHPDDFAAAPLHPGPRHHAGNRADKVTLTDGLGSVPIQLPQTPRQGGTGGGKVGHGSISNSVQALE